MYALDVLAKSGGPSLINDKVIAIFVKCAKVCKFDTEEEKKKKDKPQFYSFRYTRVSVRLYVSHKNKKKEQQNLKKYFRASY